MSITPFEQKVLDRINRERLLNLLMDLVNIPSPTGKERPIAEFYADYLRKIGLDVHLNEEYPNSPTVIGLLRGHGHGKTLQLNGHIDTIPLEHDPPCFQDGRVYGRGACDQKDGVAGMAEAVHAIIDAGVKLKGDILLTATGMHERPGAKKDSIISLAHHGPLGDAILITEAGDRGVPIVQKGLVIFDILISRPGTTKHEMIVKPGDPNPLWAGWRMLDLLSIRSEELNAEGSHHRLLGPDSIFVGHVKSGDFFNTLPTSCRIWGTRRWSPGISYAEVEAEFERMASQVAKETGVTVTVDLDKIGDPSEISEDEPIVKMVRAAHEDLTGVSWPVVGMLTLADAWIFNNIGHVPTTYYSADGSRAHATPEYVALDDVVRAAKVYALVAMRFAGVLE